MSLECPKCGGVRSPDLAAVAPCEYCSAAPLPQAVVDADTIRPEPPEPGWEPGTPWRVRIIRTKKVKKTDG